MNLSVHDFDETADWYRRVFGFEVVEDKTDSEGIRWGVIRAGDALLCIYEHEELEFADCHELRKKGFHSICHFGLAIDDREAWEKTLERENVDVQYGGAVDWPHSTAWYVSDPTGWTIEVALWHGNEIAFS